MSSIGRARYDDCDGGQYARDGAGRGRGQEELIRMAAGVDVLVCDGVGRDQARQRVQHLALRQQRLGRLIPDRSGDDIGHETRLLSRGRSCCWLAKNGQKRFRDGAREDDERRVFGPVGGILQRGRCQGETMEGLEQGRIQGRRRVRGQEIQQGRRDTGGEQGSDKGRASIGKRAEHQHRLQGHIVVVVGRPGGSSGGLGVRALAGGVGGRGQEGDQRLDQAMLHVGLLALLMPGDVALDLAESGDTVGAGGCSVTQYLDCRKRWTLDHHGRSMTGREREREQAGEEEEEEEEEMFQSKMLPWRTECGSDGGVEYGMVGVRWWQRGA
nr:hypothetical protein CFP56_28615 [Quercus suber]